MQYPLLGSTVSYIRVDGTNTIPGTGVVKAISLSPDGRVVVLVDSYNVDLATINATPDVAQAYATLIAEVDRVSKEGNDKIKAVASEYNAIVERLFNDFDGVNHEQ